MTNRNAADDAFHAAMDKSAADYQAALKANRIAHEEADKAALDAHVAANLAAIKAWGEATDGDGAKEEV